MRKKLTPYFFDTSALVKKYINEKGSDKVKEIFKNNSCILISSLSVGETLNILKCRLKGRDQEKAISHFLAEIGGGKPGVLDISFKNERKWLCTLEVRNIIKKYNVDGVDAFHLHLLLKQIIGKEILKVVCSDSKLCKAFEKEGLPVINPEGNLP